MYAKMLSLIKKRKNPSFIIVAFFCFLVALIGCKTENETKEQYQVTFTGKNGIECRFFLNYKIKNAGENFYQIDDFGFIKFMIYKILPNDELEENIDRTISYFHKHGKYPNKFHTVEKYGWKGKTINALIDEEEYECDTYNYALAKGNYYLFFTLIKNEDTRIEVSAIADEILASFRPVSPIISKEGNHYTVNFIQNSIYHQITTSHFPRTFQNRKEKIFELTVNDSFTLSFTAYPILDFKEESKQMSEAVEAAFRTEKKFIRECKFNDWKIKFWSSEKKIFCEMSNPENFIFIESLTLVEEEYLEKTIDEILELLSTFKVDFDSPIKIVLFDSAYKQTISIAKTAKCLRALGNSVEGCTSELHHQAGPLEGKYYKVRKNA